MREFHEISGKSSKILKLRQKILKFTKNSQPSLRGVCVDFRGIACFWRGFPWISVEFEAPRKPSSFTEICVIFLKFHAISVWPHAQACDGLPGAGSDLQQWHHSDARSRCRRRARTPDPTRGGQVRGSMDLSARGRVAWLLPTSYFLLPTSYFLPLPTSYLLPPTSYFLLPTSYFLLPTSYFLPPTPGSSIELPG